MKVKLDYQYVLILCYTFLIAITISCNNQNQSNQAKNKSEVGALRLKYTSGIHSILEDSKGNIWFGSYNEGVCLLHNGKFQYFTTENGLSHNQVRNIYEDKNGVIWFECGKGLSTYDGQKISKYTERNYNSKNDWKLTDNDLWFKGNEIEAYNKVERNPGVYQYDGKELSYRELPLKTKPGQKNHYSISTGFVRSKNGTLWFGTYGAVIGYNCSGFKIINDALLGLNDQTGHLHARSIMEDSKGNLWIANNGIGVLKYDGKKVINFTKQQKLKKEDTKGNSLEKVFSIGEDKLGNVWFGTVGSGVWRYDGKSVQNFGKENGVESNHIWVIYKSKKGELWIGGASPSGVYRFNGISFERIY
ncbi:two-component regulator propeller domain-containing protein [Flavobacterium sp. CSZ]|uniref:ligand-binding sensor domain-containing protein n=1 Tax=Flavobacterium sp. CSZ TaxID=2783791 RepID=UPI00188C77CD|nr:two-component regulator propeller domain-containing protein [Flavobacterium sp. CSZ]MBF4483194.1 diguanylate cyclase [Flavobacterium sp. CSZ]